MKEPEVIPDGGIGWGSLESALQSSVDEFHTGVGELDEESVISLHQDVCMAVTSEGVDEDLPCTCLPLMVSVADVARVGAREAALLLASYMAGEKRSKPLGKCQVVADE